MKRSIRKVIYWSVMILFLIIQGYPIIWLIIAGFRPNIELLTQPFAFPKSFTMENFIKIFTESNIITYIKNSAIISVISLVLIVLISSSFEESHITSAGVIRDIEFSISSSLSPESRGTAVVPVISRERYETIHSYELRPDYYNLFI